jgi:hypothetical protein
LEIVDVVVAQIRIEEDNMSEVGQDLDEVTASWVPVGVNFSEVEDQKIIGGHGALLCRGV